MKYTLLTILFFAVMVSAPALANTQRAGDTNTGENVRAGDTNSGTGGDTRSVELKNPLQSESIVELFQAILTFITILAVPVIVFFIIFAGFQYVTARGKPDAISKANSALLYAVIGGVIILGANLIMELIRNTIESF